MPERLVHPVRYPFLILLLFLIGVFSCTEEPGLLVGGSGSDTPNSLAVWTEGNEIGCLADSGTVVSVFSADYNPSTDSGFKQTVVVDEYGNSRFRDLNSGRYAVLGVSGRDLSAYISRIVVSAGSNLDTVHGEFQNNGEIIGTVTDSLGRAIDALPIYFRASPYQDTTDSSGRFHLHGIAEGAFELRSRQKVVPGSGKGKWDTLEVMLPVVSDGSQQHLGTIKFR